MLLDRKNPRLLKIARLVVLGSVCATLSLMLALIWFERRLSLLPAAARNPDYASLVAAGPDDLGWLGLYQLYTATEQLEFRPGGEYREKLTPMPKAPGGERSGTWTRTGSSVAAQPMGLTITREFALGLLDGRYVLLSEFNTWRRVPDAVATSSSR